MRRSSTFTTILMAAALPAQKPEEVQAAVDTIIGLTSTNEQRTAAMRVVLDAGFELAAGPLVRAMETCRIRRGHEFEWGALPSPEPWLDPKLGANTRAFFAINHVWTETSKSTPRPASIRTVLQILEDDRGGLSREMAMWMIPAFAFPVRPEEALGADALQRLEKIARVDKVPSIRARACALIAMQAAKPEVWVDLALAIAGTAVTPMEQSERLRETMILQTLPRMSPAARRVVLQHSFALLRRIDDGKGAGYFLAADLGQGLQIAPASRGGVPFAPDTQLPEYQYSPQRRPNMYQEMVANALAWYEKHKDD